MSETKIGELEDALAVALEKLKKYEALVATVAMMGMADA